MLREEGERKMEGREEEPMGIQNQPSGSSGHSVRIIICLLSY